MADGWQPANEAELKTAEIGLDNLLARHGMDIDDLPADLVTELVRNSAQASSNMRQLENALVHPNT